MTGRKRAERGSTLRRRAEERLSRAAAPNGEAERLLHELQVHEIELELQNEELRSSRGETETLLQRYAELFDFAPVGFFRLDGQGKILESNFAGARLLGAERQRLAGRPFHACVRPDEQRAFQTFLAEVTAAGGDDDRVSVVREVMLHHEPERWVRLTGVVLAAADGRGPSVLLAAEDVTARRAAEKALREEARHKDEFLSALSHELRNPLAPIQMALALLRATPLASEKVGRTLSVIERQTAHLTRLVEDLLDVTRISRGKIRLERKHLELGELVRVTVEDHRAGFERTKIGLRLVPASGVIWVEADASRLVQVVGNLLGNALKFTPPQGHVEVALAEEPGRAVIRVRDDGIGIAPEVLRQLFVPFSQAPQGLDRSRGGLGLGLATARGLIELHGGSIEVRSEGQGRGSEFVVRLPAAAPPARAGAIEPTTEAHS